jgi:TRAP-type C4-dicarboxylate transport system substrate-binding protein
MHEKAGTSSTQSSRRTGNMTMSVRRRGGLRLMAAVAAAGLARPAFAQGATQRWDMHLAWPSSNFHVRNAGVFARRVAEATGNAVQITIHDNGSLGLKGPETMAAVRDGIVPIAEYSFEQQTGETPLASLGAMPGLATGYDETKILLDVMRPTMDRVFERNGQKLLYAVPWPGQGVYTRNAIGGIGDLRGVKIRAANPRALEFFQALGASPILMPWAEVVPGLASGVLQGVSTSSSSGVDGKFWEFLRHYSRFDWANPLSTVTVNLDAYRRLRPEHRAAIERIGAEVEPQFWASSREEDDRNLALLRQNGIAVTEPDAALKREITRASERIWADYTRQAGADAGRIIAEFRGRTGK